MSENMEGTNMWFVFGVMAVIVYTFAAIRRPENQLPNLGTGNNTIIYQPPDTSTFTQLIPGPKIQGFPSGIDYDMHIWLNKASTGEGWIKSEYMANGTVVDQFVMSKGGKVHMLDAGGDIVQLAWTSYYDADKHTWIFVDPYNGNHWRVNPTGALMKLQPSYDIVPENPNDPMLKRPVFGMVRDQKGTLQ